MTGILSALLFFAAVLTCPLMIVLMMRGGKHGGGKHGMHSAPAVHSRDRTIAELERKVAELRRDRLGDPAPKGRDAHLARRRGR